MKCAHCKKEIHGSYIAVRVDAVEQHFCNEEHRIKFFREQDRIVLEEYARAQEVQEKK